MHGQAQKETMKYFCCNVAVITLRRTKKYHGRTPIDEIAKMHARSKKTG